MCSSDACLRTFAVSYRPPRIESRFASSEDRLIPSASKVFWAGGGIATFPASERTERSLCKTFQARNRLCFDASNSSSKSWIAFGVIDIGSSVQNDTYSRQDCKIVV